MATFGSVGVRAPEGLARLPRQVLEILAKHTVFGWAILTAQCRRADIDPERLDKQGLLKVIPYVVEGVGAFTSPEKANQVGAALWRLAHSG